MNFVTLYRRTKKRRKRRRTRRKTSEKDLLGKTGNHFNPFDNLIIAAGIAIREKTRALF